MTRQIEAVSDGYRLAMRRLAATVALISCGDKGDWAGMAATAVTSVSTEPPTLLVAVNRNASIHSRLLAEKRFCVNLLSGHHQGLIGCFSGEKKGSDRFEEGAWTEEHGMPVLTDALASLSCRLIQTLDVSTHTLFIAAVERVRCSDEVDPLIWVDGMCASIRSPDAALR